MKPRKLDNRCALLARMIEDADAYLASIEGRLWPKPLPDELEAVQIALHDAAERLKRYREQLTTYNV